ncbi:hypothetical protein GGR58DRAFT_509397 [Xylaria digitata]|nr:hypothetical protein GGR58DRAFT_509397 [Xylaria digitata]
MAETFQSKTPLGPRDGSRRVYLLASQDPGDEDPASKPAGVSAGLLHIPMSGSNQHAIRRPRPFLPHPELLPPGIATRNGTSHKLTEGQESAREYIQSAQLVLHIVPTVGTVRGVGYAAALPFRKEAHFNEDLNEP